MKYLITIVSLLLFLSGCEDRGYGGEDISNVPTVSSTQKVKILTTTPREYMAKSSYINIECSSYIDKESLSDTITLQEKGSLVAIDLSISVADNHIYVAPLEGLQDKSSYILSLNSSIKDIFGNSLDKDYRLEFSVKENFYKSVEAGEKHSVALSMDGDIYIWGAETDISIGNESATISIPLGLTDSNSSKKYSAGSATTAMIREDGRLWSIGALALKDNQESDFKEVSIGSRHSAVLKEDGTLWSWGSNAKGALGNLGIFSQTKLTQEHSNSTHWVTLGSGDSFSVAIKDDSTLWGWGDNEYGQIGTPSTLYKERREPTQEDSNATDWKSVSAGYNHTAALKIDGTLYSWGKNSSGALGDGSNNSTTTAVQESTHSKWKSVTAGYDHTVAIRDDGTLWSWGANDYGQLGNGTTDAQNSPVMIGADSYKSVSAGKYFTLAIKSDGTLWVWGYNAYKQLGLGDNSDSQNIPTEVK